MIIAYHAIFTTYGTWLPNDPRGSFSTAIYNEELAALGEIRFGRQDPQPSTAALRRFRTAAVPHLARPAFFLDDSTRRIVAGAFAMIVNKFELQVPACAIMNEHVHFLALRSGYRIEYLVNQLKGAGTKAMGLSQTPWARNCWKVFIDDWETLRAAAEYIQQNPGKSGLAPQTWEFVVPPSEV